MSILISLFYWISILQISATVSTDDDELRLIKDLLNNYSREVRPVKDKTLAIQVHFGVAYTQLVELDEKNQVMISNVWIRQTWNNHLLRWNHSNYGGIKSINVDPIKVWLPDVVLYNNADSALSSGNMDNFKTRVILNYDGTNTWYAPTILRSRCPMSIEYFPFDDQKCPLRFGSWTYDGLRVDLVNRSSSVDLIPYMPSGEFQMINAPVQREIITYTCCPEPYPNLVFTIHIRRKVLFYFNNLIIPCFLITGFALLTFTLPPNTGERVTLVITTLLAMTVFMLMIAENTPTTSDVTPLIGKFFVASMVEIGLALIATCVVLNLFDSARSVDDIPTYIRVFFLEWLGPILYISSPTKKIYKRNHCFGSGPPVSESNGTTTTDRDLNDSPKSVVVMAPGVGEKPLSTRDYVNSIADSNVRYRGVNHAAMERILEGIHILSDRAKDKEKTETIQEEWVTVARVCDRFFFIIFVLTISFSTSYIFLTKPSYEDTGV